MRTFYIFKINPEFSILMKDSPYNLYKTIEQIKNLSTTDLDLALNIFNQFAEIIDKKKINIGLFEEYKNNQHYTKYKNTHIINNFYRDEETKLEVKKTYLLLKSTEASPNILKNLNIDENLFACDFKNSDYFWIDSLANNF